MEIQDIEKLAQIMKQADLGEILVEQGDFRVRLRKDLPAASRDFVSYATMPMTAAAAPAPAAPQAAPAPTTAAAAASRTPREEGLVEFTSPMVGTFYSSPSPDSEPFVAEGSKVTPDKILCIIEAMKVMNEIRAEMSGEIVKTFVKNGEPIEYGQPLFLIRPS